jgi:hypothetical protein
VKKRRIVGGVREIGLGGFGRCSGYYVDVGPELQLVDDLPLLA